MTVSSTSNKSPLYVGNATTGPWAFAFKTFAASDLEVVQADANGIETILVLTTDYTVSLNADQDNDPGGEVTTVAAVPNDGSTIIIRWNADATQGLDLQTAGGFYPEAQEDAFDRLTMLVQKVAEETGRALKVSLTAGETVGTEIGGGVAARANRYLGFDAAGDLTLSSSFSAGALTVSAFMETVLDDTTASAARATLGAADAATAATLAANTFTGVQRWAKGADVASATALTLGTDGNYFDITGTTAITSIGTLGVGTVVKLHFDGALTLTHHATDLILPGAANITTAAGTEIELVEYATGDWRMVGGVKADGTAWVVAASGAIIQVVEGTPYTTYSSTATAIPNDDTIPQNTEGAEWVTVTITPTSATNRLVIEANMPYVAGNAAIYATCALFQDTTANALASATQGCYAGDAPSSIYVRHEMAAGTTSATTFKLRAGAANAGTLYVNGLSGGRKYGGVNAVMIRVTEVSV